MAGLGSEIIAIPHKRFELQKSRTLFLLGISKKKRKQYPSEPKTASKRGIKIIPYRERRKKMKRIDLEWGEGKGTIILEPIAPIGDDSYLIWSYEMDHENFHKKFGGSNYYQSRTGLTGAGWIPNNLQTARLIFPGTVRTDLASWQFYKGQEIAPGMELYVPYKKNEGIVGEYVIIRYTKDSPFYHGDDSLMYLPAGTEDTEENYKKITSVGTFKTRLELVPIIWDCSDPVIDIIPWDGNWKERCIEAYGENARYLHGLHYNTKYTYPIMLQAEKLVIDQFRDGFPERSWFEKKLGLIQVDGKYHGYTPAYIKPKSLDPWSPDFENRGWHYTGCHMWVRRNTHNDKVEVFMYIREGKYQGYEYEWEMTPYEYNKYTFSGLFREGKKEIRKKYDTDSYYRLQESLGNQGIRQYIKTLLEENLAEVLTVADSVAAGNCHVGTRKWMNRYGINDNITVAELLKKERIDAMVEDRDFQRVVWVKFEEEERNGN
jgi:hypothetical protein